MGDVYKRQSVTRTSGGSTVIQGGGEGVDIVKKDAVSYTHLTALAAGSLPQLRAQLLTGQQHCAAHQRHQHQQRSKQCCPKGLSTSTAHGIHRLSFA